MILVFAFADDGSVYKLTKRSTDGHLTDKFAFYGNDAPRERFARNVNLQMPGKNFEFAFQKRAINTGRFL